MAWKPADASYPPDIEPSDLRHRITFLEQSTVSDASGTSPSWDPASPPVTTWAAIEEPKGQNVVQDGQDISKVDAVVTIRYRAGVQTNQRFQDAEGNVYLILAVTKPKAMNVKLVMLCQILGTNQ